MPIDTPIATNRLILGPLLERQARYRPDRVGVISPEGARDVALTWRQLDRYVTLKREVRAPFWEGRERAI